ncbi:MAG: rhodanese-like domain-containing protein [Sphingomonas sp.]
MFTTLITAPQLAALIQGGELTLFDCGFELGSPDAGHAAFLEAHLPGACYLHLDDDLAAPATGGNGRHPLPDPEAFAALMRANGLNRGEQVVAYDASGGAFAARLWWLLRWLGHDRVAVLDGGRKAWLDAGLPMAHGPVSKVAPGDFSAAPRAGWTVAADAVEANITAPGFTVLDTRSASRFRGEPNPMDPVAGHIPGARSRFYGDNLDAGGPV